MTTTPALPTDAHALTDLRERFERLSVKRLIPSDTNPRKLAGDDRTLDTLELETSVRQRGVLEPLIVRPHTRAGMFEIVAGERRWRAAVASTIDPKSPPDVPCIIRAYTDAEACEVQLLENLQRKDLTLLEQAEGLRALVDTGAPRGGKTRPTAVAHDAATRLGVSVAWVFETMSLTKLVPAAKRLLQTGRITRTHAALLAAQTAEAQAAMLDVDAEDLRGTEQRGLWTRDHGRDLLAAAAEDGPTKKADADPYPGLKPVSVRELARWIEDHVRFDVAHAAQAQPFDFGPLAERVDLAPKTIPITFEYHVAEDARDDEQRTYGTNSWQRADGQPNPGEKKPSKTCAHAVLGLVVAGRGRGQAFLVCVNREKCKVHFRDSALAAERRKKTAATAKVAPGKKAAAPKGPTKAELDAQAKREAADRERQAWHALEPKLLDAIYAQLRDAGSGPLTPAEAARILKGNAFENSRRVTEVLGKDWFTTPAAAICVAHFDSGYDLRSYDKLVAEAKAFGLDVKPLVALRDAALAPKKPAAKK